MKAPGVGTTEGVEESLLAEKKDLRAAVVDVL